MRDRDTKRRTSATDKGDHDVDAPSDVHVAATIELGGQYGAAPAIFSGQRYCLRSVLQNPLRDYPSPEALYGMELGGALSQHPVFATNFGAGEDHTGVFTRDSLASAAIGAERAQGESIEMCTWDAIKQKLAVIRPFSDKDDIFYVYKLPARRVVVGSTKHTWAFGARWGPMATGCWPNWVEDKQQPKSPPLPRKVNWRDLLRILQASNQIGLPTSVKTDGKLGWASYAYMSPEILLNHCHGAQPLLLRVEGVRPKGSEALKNELSQGAKCGICPCCALATHVLAPAAYGVGRYDRREANTTRLWQRFGPMATRNYAAAVYYNLYGPLPTSRNWLATRHSAKLPPPPNPEDSRMVEDGDSQWALDDESGPIESPALHSPTPSPPSPATQHPKVANPPPPIYPPRFAPSPAKPSGPSKGNQSRGGDWSSRRDPPWDWNARKWRR